MSADPNQFKTLHMRMEPLGELNAKHWLVVEWLDATTCAVLWYASQEQATGVAKEVGAPHIFEVSRVVEAAIHKPRRLYEN